MKPLNTFLLLSLIALEVTSCNDSRAGKETKDPTVSSGAMDDASFSCMVDGKIVSGKGTDQNINAAFHLTGDNKGQIFFRLSDMNNTGDKFIFQVPAKRGSTTFTVSPGYSYAGYATSDLASYIDDPVTVTITSITASGISGTFSGKYTLSKGTGNSNSKQIIEVTGGKFNIPFSTSAEWKQLYHAE